MTLTHQESLERLGFRFGINGPHAARTMMLDELRLLLDHLGPDASTTDYGSAIIDSNILGKPSRKARELTFRHLATLYALDVRNPIFRAMRRLWSLNTEAQPMLAVAVALARDPLLRATQEFYLSQTVGSVIPRESVEQLLSTAFPDRFSPASLKSFAQNVGGTWTSAGLLTGRNRKIRTSPALYPESLTLFLLLSYLEGRTGQRLFTSSWLQVLGSSPDELEALANSASHRGLLVFMNAGGVKEVRFPGYLTPEEEQIRLEASHVV